MTQGPEQSEHLAAIDLDDDLVVYDRRRHQVYVLPPLRAYIWESCDGSRSIDDLIDLLVETDPDRVTPDTAADAVIRTIRELTSARLLKGHG